MVGKLAELRRPLVIHGSALFLVVVVPGSGAARGYTTSNLPLTGLGRSEEKAGGVVMALWRQHHPQGHGPQVPIQLEPLDR